ncbi:MAG: SGNH/GDSL hydrolase family protein, partial [Myxococcaceae bacterium]
KPDDPAIRYIGRIDSSSPDGPTFSLAGSTVRVRFSGTKIGVQLREGSGDQGWNNFYDVFIDGALAQVLETHDGRGDYVLASGLPNAEHELIFTKRTEPWIGQTQILGLTLDPGATVTKPVVADRRIEFVGDSITVGLGDEGASEACTYSPTFQNHDASFAALVAKALDAEHVAMAASGVGVVIDWHGTTETLMGDIYDRALIERAGSKWSFDWKPQAVVVNLGTTDFTKGDPGRTAFVAKYVALLRQIRSKYPDAVIFAVLGPMLRDAYPPGVQSLQLAREYIQQAISDASDSKVQFVELTPDDGSRGFGCDYHPNKATHALVADELVAAMKSRLGW